MTDIDTLSNAPATVTIDGVEYTIDRIRQGAVAKTVRWVKDQRMQAFLDQTRHVNIPDDTRGKALAEIACHTPSFVEVLDDYEAKLYLLSLSVKANGQPVRFTDLRDKMPAETCKTLGDVMFSLAGGGTGGDNGNPTKSSTSITET